MTGFQAVLNDIISLLGGSIGEMGKQIGTGIGETVSALFLETNESGEVTGISLTAGVIAIFGGISLTCGLTYLVTRWIFSLGGRKV